MPKIVDHDERRRLIAEQVIRSAASEGLAGLGMRRIAARLGMSLGALQHDVASADDLPVMAAQLIADRRRTRVGVSLATLGRTPTERDILRASALAAVPADDERRDECLAEAVLLGRLVAERSPVANGVTDLITFVEALIEQARQRGELAEGADPGREARIFWAVVSSQAQGILAGVASPHEVIATIDYWLDRVLPQPDA